MKKLLTILLLVLSSQAWSEDLPPPGAKPGKATLKPLPDQPVPWEGGKNLALPPPEFSERATQQSAFSGLSGEIISQEKQRFLGCLKLTAPVTSWAEVKLQFELLPNGQLKAPANPQLAPGSKGVQDSLLPSFADALKKCAPYNQLPPEDYAGWKQQLWQFRVTENVVSVVN